MKNYTITVNGKAYDVIVEEKSGTSAAPAAPAPVQAAAPVTPVVAPAPSAPAAPAAATGSAGQKVSAPMPGKIINVKANVGDQVKNGQEVIIMEAMKMHNPILANKDGVIAEIFVKAGDAVQSGTALFSIQ